MGKKKTIRTIAICAGLIVAGSFIALRVFHVPTDTIFYTALLLACPLMHVIMMSGGKHKH